VPEDDPFDLERFVEAQDRQGTYIQAVRELRQGHKTSHWMWFVFPQLAGLGHSATSQRYAIGSLGEALAYLHHPVLGPRLRECIDVLMGVSGQTADDIFGSVDAQKLRSSMTLFLRASPHDCDFAQVLDRYFDGQPDATTDGLL
jgi:uncharacterized protein (DUF1810 family)